MYLSFLRAVLFCCWLQIQWPNRICCLDFITAYYQLIGGWIHIRSILGEPAITLAATIIGFNLSEMSAKSWLAKFLLHPRNHPAATRRNECEKAKCETNLFLHLINQIHLQKLRHLITIRLS